MVSLALEAFRCPDDATYPLREDSGTLCCPRCGRRFAADDGIVQMLPLSPPGVAKSVELAAAERRQRDQEATRYDSLWGLRLLSRLELPATLGPLGFSAGDRVVDVGCGTGRFTLPLVRVGAMVVAVDHSIESLRVLKRKLAAEAGTGVPSPLLVQGDASCLPIRDGWANRAVSAQVLEHIPAPELREAVVAELARVLMLGGRAALSAYWYAPLLRGLLQREGQHSDAIFYHRFERRELAELLEQRFVVERLTGRLVYVLLAHLRRRD
jgi:SAM-dependent methyltransferase